jgi:eukaryotic-like serine/threonine-protein kinase
VDACLRAAHHGLLVLLWQVLCPLCRIPSDFAESLNALAQHGRCPSCNLNFQIDFVQALELVFRVSPRVRTSELRPIASAVRHLPRTSSRRSGWPRTNASHSTSRSLSARMSCAAPSCRISSRSPRVTRRPRTARARGVAGGRADAAGARAAGPDGPSDRGGNQLEREIVVRLERSARREDALTAARATCLASFRLLFPGEVLKAGRLVAVGHTAFLLAAIHDQRRLLAQLGDARAFERAMEYWTWLGEIVAAEGGATVKTASGITLCAFESAASAVRAAIGLRSRADALDPSHGKSQRARDLRLAVHQGSALAATLDGRLDYFGASVEAAIELVSHAPPAQILLSWEVARDQEVAVDVTRAGCVLEMSDADRDGDFGVLVVSGATQLGRTAV